MCVSVFVRYRTAPDMEDVTATSPKKTKAETKGGKTSRKKLDDMHKGIDF